MPHTDTKERIFNEAVRQFSERSYNVVTVREIASAVGVNESAIYRHFESKADILGEIMAAFCRTVRKYLMTPERAEACFQRDTPRQLLRRLNQNFHDDEALFLLRAYRIICMEQFTNPVARELVLRFLFEEVAKSIRYVLDLLIAHEKIPAVDTRRLSELWADFLYAQAVSWVQCFDSDGNLISEEFSDMSEFMVDMALSGSLPSG